MKRFILILLLLAPFFSQASHIVGGEFELRHISGSQYRLTLILYFDHAHGSPGAKDLSANVSIFRMFDNVRMMNVLLPLTEELDVLYTNPDDCSNTELDTRKLIYQSFITLSATMFNHSDGYYVAWERCCRNYGINNIFSESPTFPDGSTDPTARFAGQTFYLEFPPVVKDGQPFIDSTPELFPPLSDYGCNGKPYYVNFGGTDIDGDSLAYSLVTPLTTQSGDAFPPNNLPRPKLTSTNAYPTVTWQPGYSLEQVMQGNPDLAISDDGWLTVTPVANQNTLYVFAVKCEEFRDGVKIGETRRDFQMLVLPCPVSAAPVVIGRKLGDAAFSYRNTMAVTFASTASEEDRCIEIEITDDDIFTDGSEKVSIWKVIGLGNKNNKTEVSWPKSITTLTPSSPSVIFKICFDECPPKENTPYQIGIIVKDDACALPLLDTLRVTVLVQTPPNSPARFIDPVPDVSQSLFEGTSQQWPIEAVDDDGDALTFSFLTDGFNLVDFGMALSISQPQTNNAVGSLLWDAKCDVFDFSQRQNFNITMLADDADKCKYNKADTAHFYLRLINPSADPIIDTDITPVFSERYADAGAHRIYDNAIQFNVFGTDADPFPISLEAEGVDFSLTDYGIEFPEVSGNSPIQSPFKWTLSCSQFDLVEKDTFAIRFMVVDKNNKCKIYQADTVEVGFKILPPHNTKPALSIDNLHPETTIASNTLKTFWDKPIELMLTGTDTEVFPIPDNITIELIDVESSTINPPDGYTFAPAIPATAPTQVQTKFSWAPDCAIFKNGVFDNKYIFTFRTVDDHCESAMADTVAYVVNIADYISTDDNFLPPNVITPNGDGVNDFFGLDGYELRDNGTDPDNEINLPLDNCVNQFEYIKIFNRWGKLVYTSTNRYFKWYAPEATAGVYYYFLKFSHDEYKSSISVRY